jgi:hypothetical protein
MLYVPCLAVEGTFIVNEFAESIEADRGEGALTDDATNDYSEVESKSITCLTLGKIEKNAYIIFRDKYSLGENKIEHEK